MEFERLKDTKIETKLTNLKKARDVLKTEFVGLDSVIDELIKSVSNWYLFPEIQERPVVVNLWGLTGVGKTALILRLGELLEYEKKLYKYDMGSRSRRNTSLKEVLRNLFIGQKDDASMIVLDEFQHASTIDENEMEIENDFSRVVWDLLDSGKFQTYSYNSTADQLTRTRELLDKCLKFGVTVENGVVTSNLETFVETMALDEESLFDFEFDANHIIHENGKELYSFIPRNVITSLYDTLGRTISITDFKNRVMRLDGEKSVLLFDKAIEMAKSNEWIDCSKCIIFVIGNLDEAYTMSSSLNPDKNADDFHEESKKISINHIKHALKRRFRYEQIARLGNNHIIYPAFSRSSFYELINLELSKTSKRYLEKFGIELQFTSQFVDLIYSEGVFPTQGTRPVFSTIYRFVNARFADLYSTSFLKDLGAQQIKFNYKEEKIEYQFIKSGKTIFKYTEEPILHLSKLRKAPQDNMQALVAVHEAGHAVVSIAALKSIPEYICSTTSDIAE